MAGTITHYWDGTKLVVTSDSGTSSCDLKGEKGDTGVRGAQGSPGIVLIDSALATPGYGADAKAVGERFAALEEQIGAVDKTIKVKEVTQSYASVQSAGGSENIVDGLPTRVHQIQGNTVCLVDTDTLKNVKMKGIKCTGKNLINVDSNLSWTTLKTLNVILPAGTYTLQCDSSTSEGEVKPAISFYNEADSSDGFTLETHRGTSITKALKGGSYQVYIYANGYNYNGSVGVNATIKNLMLSKGEGVKEYQPYKESYFELPEVTDLRKWDILYPQEGKILKGAGVIEFTGTEYWTDYNSTDTIGGYWTDALDTLAKKYAQAICNEARFKYSAGGEVAYTFYIGGGAANTCFKVSKSDYPTIADWKAYLAQMHAAGTPLTLVYELAEPITEIVELPKDYIVYKDGIEQIVHDGTSYTQPTLRQEYYVWVGGSEE